MGFQVKFGQFLGQIIIALLISNNIKYHKAGTLISLPYRGHQSSVLVLFFESWLIVDKLTFTISAARFTTVTIFYCKLSTPIRSYSISTLYCFYSLLVLTVKFDQG